LLEAHGANHFRLGTDEHDPGSFADFGEIRVFAQKPVAGVNGIHVRDFGGTDDRRNIQLAAGAFRRPDADSFVRKPHVE
jgi:hypothetical protein